MTVNPEHLRLVEALIFASAEPIEENRLSERLPDDADLKELLQQLQSLYESRGVRLVQVGKAWAFRTAPDLAEFLVAEREQKRRLSRAAIESLAVIAYHQPVTRAEIEEIRGVSQSKGTLDVLMEAGWIKSGRRRETPGRPVTWLTTPAFLDHFGFENLRDLPGVAELRASGFLDARPAIQAFRTEDIEQDAADADSNDEADDEADGEQEEGAEEERAPFGDAEEAADASDMANVQAFPRERAESA